MKNIASIIFLICIFVLSGCNSEISQTVETQSTTNSDTVTNEPSNSLVDSKPTTNGELFEFVIDKWKHNRAADLYEYADSELTNLLNKNDFSYLFDSLSCLGG